MSINAMGKSFVSLWTRCAGKQGAVACFLADYHACPVPDAILDFNKMVEALGSVEGLTN